MRCPKYSTSSAANLHFEKLTFALILCRRLRTAFKSFKEESLIESFDMDFSTICECRVLWQGKLKRGCPERQRHLHLLKTVHLG
uniref:Uncharacterized protein n=1 Tax=Chromera velia CCMP2878 TaxID=1169474 RepID=A0A0G4HH43_9ALVE|eukprot:Cvel_27514.t1-p1 / transcript=Cvel_27514.t1 / gene=Cvel_27514 / organism=Chromera_velia_CCMP2878 / gene_product=hypothetical protein / transcript_product=hypothetical protein / location=Cvel_scaffold3447:6589-8248(-) / protein_length=83 / sequence_SO=supercontig / SO=protein_coding / is_pseudo=false